MTRLRNRLFCTVLTCFGLSLCSLHANSATLIVNGSFDNVGNVFVNNTGLGSDDQQSPGATNIPSWANVPGFVNEFWAAPGNSYGLTASPGNASGYLVDLTGQANNKPYGGIEQSIATIAGQTYFLKFDLGASTFYNNSTTGQASLTASAGGVSQLFSLAPTSQNTWQTETLSFVALSGTTNVEFLANSAFTSQYTGLDNVSVNVGGVPEPSTWAMMLLGFGGLGFLAYRKACKNDAMPMMVV